MSSRMDTIWSKLDRKSTAIAEFTMRQYRTRISTWVVMGASVFAVFLMLLFYIEAMNTEIEAIDNDGDSFDTDGDGYPDGQERLEGTNPNSDASFPSWVEPDPPEKWINEDDIEWDNLADGENYVGKDDDGDCLNQDTSSQRDNNDNNVDCDIIVTIDSLNGTVDVNADNNVDEDPDEDRYGKEAGHRAFILGIGKFGIVYLLGIFLPLFLATGLIREEMTEGTIHYMLAKPIARGEVLLYRMLGYLGITWPFIIGLCFVLSLITGFAGPGDDLFRWADFGVWMSIAWSAMMVSLVYGTIFCGFGIIWKNGVILAILFAAWELGMAFVTILVGGTESSIRYFSVIGWGMIIVDSGAAICWPDNWQLIESGLWGGGKGEENWLGEYEYAALPGAVPLATFSGDSSLGVSEWLAFIISTVVLLFQGVMSWFIGQTIFKGKEVD